MAGIHKFSVGQTVTLKSTYKPTKKITLPAGTRGRVTKIYTRKIIKCEFPYDVKWDGFNEPCPMRESEIR